MKKNLNGNILRFKARLVAKGYSQVARFDFNETFSPAIKSASLRVVLSIALARGWLMKQLDVNNAFLNGVLQEEVYMEQPIGFKKELERQHLVCKLFKALYGLQEAPRLGLISSKTLYTKWGFNHPKLINLFL